MTFLAVIDPNWSADAGGGGRGANNHYALDDVHAIAQSLKTSQPWSDVGPGLLWMWATGSALISGDAFRLVNLLDFRVCAGFVWAKIDETDPWRVLGDDLGEDLSNEPFFRPPARLGLGQWSRVEHEHLLVCRRGDLKVPRPELRERSIIYAPRGEHSAKPEEAWRVIESVSRDVMPGVVGVEYNARVRRPGWAAVGRIDGEENPIRFEQPQPQETAC